MSKKNTTVLCALYLAAYACCLIGDIRYLVKWNSYGERGSAGMLFVLLMLVHLIFPILAYVWYRKGVTERNAVAGRIVLLVILGLAAAFSIMTANSMTDYVYRSKYGGYDLTTEEFQAKGTLRVTSADLKEGIWDSRITNTGAGENLSPELTFDTVEGASYYVIYMVDESANNWVHWYAQVTANLLRTGENPGQYDGPYPPRGSGEHTYTVYVYALAGDPGAEFDGTFPEFDEPWFGGEVLWRFLNIKDAHQKPVRYGNVLAYGSVSGGYER